MNNETVKSRTFSLSLSNQERYKMGRLISLGLVVEKDSPAATKSPLEEVQRCLMVKDAKRQFFFLLKGVCVYKKFITIAADKKIW